MPSSRPATSSSHVRRPGTSLYDAIGLQDMTTDDVYFERGINMRHGYLGECYVEDGDYIVPLPAASARPACCSSRSPSPRRRSTRRTRSSAG